MDKTQCFLEIFDSYGQEEYAALTREYMTRYPSFMYIFSVTNVLDEQRKKYTIEKLEELIKYRDGQRNFPIIFAINKVDVPESKRATQVEEIKQFIFQLIGKYNFTNTEIFEISAKVRINIEEIFSCVIRRGSWSQFDAVAALKMIIEKDTQVLEISKKKKCTIQ